MAQSPSKISTTIRMGAAHCDLRMTGIPGRGPLELPLRSASRKELSQIARHLCEAHGITSDTSHPIKTTEDKNRHGKRSKHRNRPAAKLSGQEPAGQAPANDGPKKRSRRRRAPRSVSASGLAAH